MTLVGVGVAGAALALSGTTAFAGQEDAATGGGQILVGTNGAGDTSAFTAEGTSSAAKGQVQYVDRTGGTGQGQTVMHGTVTCIDVQGNIAMIGGAWRDGGVFGLYVEDNGEGSAAMDDTVTLLAENTCDYDEPDEKWGLARGNAQVRDRS
jgi:hypothetical protein